MRILRGVKNKGNRTVQLHFAEATQPNHKTPLQTSNKMQRTDAGSIASFRQEHTASTASTSHAYTDDRQPNRDRDRDPGSLTTLPCSPHPTLWSRWSGLKMGIDVNSRSNWLESNDPISVGSHGGAT